MVHPVNGAGMKTDETYRKSEASFHVDIARGIDVYCGVKGGGRKWTGKGEERNGMGSFSVLSRCANVAATLRRSRRSTLARATWTSGKRKMEGNGRKGEKKKSGIAR